MIPLIIIRNDLLPKTPKQKHKKYRKPKNPSFSDLLKKIIAFIDRKFKKE